MKNVDWEKLQNMYDITLKNGHASFVFRKDINRYRSFMVSYFCWSDDSLHIWLKVTEGFNDGNDYMSADVRCYAHPFEKGKSPTYYNKSQAWSNGMPPNFWAKLESVPKRKNEIKETLKTFFTPIKEIDWGAVNKALIELSQL